MNKKKLTFKEAMNYRKYHIPDCHNYVKRTKKAIHLNTHNNIEHERMKFEICYELQKSGCLFITEASRNVKKGEKEKIVDIVDLSGGVEIEIVNKHESDEEIAQYRKDGVMVIIVNQMNCLKCGERYPKRNKKDICQICKKGSLK